MPNRDLDDDAVDPIADDEDEDVLGSTDDDDDTLDDEEDEEFDEEEEDEEVGLTDEVGSEGGSPGEAVERVRSRADVGGSEADGLARDEEGGFRRLRDDEGVLRKRTP